MTSCAKFGFRRRVPTWLAPLLVALLALSAAGGSAAAGDQSVPQANADNAAPVAGPAAADRAESNQSSSAATGLEKPPETLWEMIKAGGTMNLIFMGFLGLFSLVAAAVTMERLVNLTRRKVIPAHFVRDLKELVRKGEYHHESYSELCQRTGAPIAQILKAGLLRAGRPMMEIEKSMEDAAAREMAGMRARIRPLSVVASVAPLLGLLGTVTGMLGAFRTASQAGLGKAELLAEGIYLALETTVAGLVIAIPALLFAAIFVSRAERLMRQIDEHLMEAMPAMPRIEPPGTPADRTAARTARSNPLL